MEANRILKAQLENTQGALGKENMRSCTVEVANGKRSLDSGEKTLEAETESTLQKGTASTIYFRKGKVGSKEKSGAIVSRCVLVCS